MVTSELIGTRTPVCNQPITPRTKELIPTYGKYQFFKWEFETPLKWSNIFYMSLWHVLSVIALYKYPFWNHWGLYTYAILVGGMSTFGVTAGAHRYWSHKSFKAKLPLRLILLFCFSLSGEYSVKSWARDHRIHHKFSETDADPHNAKRGFFFAHIGWTMMKKHPEVIRKGLKVDVSDLFEDPLVAFHERHFNWFKWTVAFILPALVPPYLLGETWLASILTLSFLRYVVALHGVLSINSAAHLWGNRPYNKSIFPTENLLVSFLAMGEGYHNYHHTFPWDYRASEFGKFGLNLTAFWLDVLVYLGWAYDLKTPSPELVKKVVENNGDGSHLKWGHEVPIEENCGLTEMKKDF